MKRKGKYVKCPQCREFFERISTHWIKSATCSHPPLTPLQRSLVEAALIDGGRLSPDPEHPGNYQCEYSHEERAVLEWFHDAFGELSLGVSEAAGKDRHLVRTRHHPDVSDLYDRWYPDGSKRVPDRILTSGSFVHALYAFVGSRGHADDPELPAFDVSRTDVTAARLADLLEDFRPVCVAPDYETVILRDVEQFFETIGPPPADAVANDWPAAER